MTTAQQIVELFAKWCRAEGCTEPIFSTFGYWINEVAPEECKALVFSLPNGAGEFWQKYLS